MFTSIEHNQTYIEFEGRNTNNKLFFSSVKMTNQRLPYIVDNFDINELKMRILDIVVKIYKLWLFERSKKQCAPSISTKKTKKCKNDSLIQIDEIMFN